MAAALKIFEGRARIGKGKHLVYDRLEAVGGQRGIQVGEHAAAANIDAVQGTDLSSTGSMFTPLPGDPDA